MYLQDYDTDNAYLNTNNPVFINNTVMYINSNVLCLLYLYYP